jgi:hypothetical protein
METKDITTQVKIKQPPVLFSKTQAWFYRAEERRWITLNDNSGWRRIEKVGSCIKRSEVHFS